MGVGSSCASSLYMNELALSQNTTRGISCRRSSSLHKSLLFLGHERVSGLSVLLKITQNSSSTRTWFELVLRFFFSYMKWLALSQTSPASYWCRVSFLCSKSTKIYTLQWNGALLLPSVQDNGTNLKWVFLVSLFVQKLTIAPIQWTLLCSVQKSISSMDVCCSLFCSKSTKMASVKQQGVSLLPSVQNVRN